MEKVLKHLGLALIIIGAVLIILTMLVPGMGDMADHNWYTLGSLSMIVAGLLAHILFNKYLSY